MMAGFSGDLIWANRSGAVSRDATQSGVLRVAGSLLFPSVWASPPQRGAKRQQLPGTARVCRSPGVFLGVLTSALPGFTSSALVGARLSAAQFTQAYPQHHKHNDVRPGPSTRASIYPLKQE